MVGGLGEANPASWEGIRRKCNIPLAIPLDALKTSSKCGSPGSDQKLAPDPEQFCESKSTASGATRAIHGDVERCVGLRNNRSVQANFDVVAVDGGRTVWKQGNLSGKAQAVWDITSNCTARSINPTDVASAFGDGQVNKPLFADSAARQRHGRDELEQSRAPRSLRVSVQSRPRREIINLNLGRRAARAEVQKSLK